MARWEPDARGRLLRAALDLFAEQGYERTTTAQIASRAGLTKTTFFRHFPDKREVLFYGQPMLMELATNGVRDAPADATPLDAAAAGVDAMASAHVEGQREYAPQLGAVVAANDELRERAAFKRASIAGAMADALVVRGVDERVAALAAELGARAYYTAFDRWIAPANTEPMPDLARTALTELRAAAAALA
ncbi:TetR/AcrR family transcriptional regulator [Frondihabitans australicus]|uniref:TetR family transcriptional regulator n=1 Tax=Frondihabitans australicus TaxID=386892 RepID=A0A495IJ16_9MICO|nr:TetR/AcrR family transcriptional regulator [Frondihabitans australicus]RKR75967.1 TetR family transcriptional regulator [Frondihabitans australicus]